MFDFGQLRLDSSSQECKICRHHKQTFSGSLSCDGGQICECCVAAAGEFPAIWSHFVSLNTKEARQTIYDSASISPSSSLVTSQTVNQVDLLFHTRVNSPELLIKSAMCVISAPINHFHFYSEHRHKTTNKQGHWRRLAAYTGVVPKFITSPKVCFPGSVSLFCPVCVYVWCHFTRKLWSLITNRGIIFFIFALCENFNTGWLFSSSSFFFLLEYSWF